MRKQIEQCANRNRVRADMRKCGNMCLYRRALTGVLAVLLAVEISACGGKAKPRAGDGSESESRNNSGEGFCSGLEGHEAGAQYGSFLCEAVFGGLL